VHDGPVVDANRFDASGADRSDGDAARESGLDDGGGTQRCSPLPDGTGRLTFVASGGAAFDIRLGNDGTCDSKWSQGTDLFLVFFIPVPLGDAGGNPTGLLSVQVPGAPPGLTGAGLLAGVDLLMSGHIWRSGTVCTATLTGNELVDSGPSYKLTGSVNCTAALPETGGREPLTIVQFDFVVSATP
jgi:hypothetical protein